MVELILPTFEDVNKASHRIAPYINKTPILTSRYLNKILDMSLFFKCENFQRSGSFKFRGAMNTLSQFSKEQKKSGVVAYSSGNHAQAIALAANILNIPATIIMPHDAPTAKVSATKGYGGNIIIYNRYTDDREQIGKEIAEQQGLTLVPPYNHPHVIAGQGTAVKELLEEQGMLDALFIPLGGGGLLSGSSLSAKYLSSNCKIYGVEPQAGNDGQMSFRSRKIIHIDTPKTIADGAQTQHLGEYTFSIIKQNVNDILTVSDEELIAVMRLFAERMKIVVEPTGCLAFAAAYAMKDVLQGQRVGVIISGGNIDTDRYCQFLSKI